MRAKELIKLHKGAVESESERDRDGYNIAFSFILFMEIIAN